MHDSSLAFRAQLLIPEQRHVFDYWMARRGTRAMPPRRAIEPRGLRQHLSTVSLYDVVGDRHDFACVWQGQNYVKFTIVTLTGAYVDELDFLSLKPLERLSSEVSQLKACYLSIFPIKKI